MAFSWSDAKKKLFRLQSDVLVSASAGTGKTTALVELCVRLLDGRTSLGPVPLENIVLITFTRRAAGELVERLKARLSNPEQSPNPKALSHALGKLDQAYIHTFHSFAMRLLRERGPLAQVPLDFEQPDEATGNQLFEDAFNQVFRDALEQADQAFIQLLRVHGREALRGAIREMIGLSGGYGVNEFSREERLRGMADRYSEAYTQARAVGETLSAYLAGSPKIKAESLDRYRAIEEALTEDWPPFSAGVQGAERLRLLQERCTIPGSRPKALKEVIPLLKESITTALAQIYEYETLPLAEALTILAKQVFKRLQADKRRLGLLDFNDLLVETVEGLRTDAAWRSQLAQRFRVILVDEFQDTDRQQMALLNLLLEVDPQNLSDSAAVEIPSRLVFVGDAKQSIYRFRGADVTVFKETADAWRKEEKVLYFQENYRSQPDLLRVFNEASQRVFWDDHTDYGIHFSEDDALTGGRPTAGTMPAHAELLWVEADEDVGQAESRSLEARALARRIGQILGGEDEACLDPKTKAPPTAKDVVLLFQRMTHAKEYEQALVSEGFSCVSHGGRGFLGRQEIQDALHLAQLIVRPLQAKGQAQVLRGPAVMLGDTALAGVMMSEGAEALGRMMDDADTLQQRPWFSMLHPDEQSRLVGFSGKLRRWKHSLRTLSVDVWLEQVLRESGLLALASAHPEASRKLANLEALLRLATDLRPLDLPDFLTKAARSGLERRGEAAVENPGDVIRLMTIHQAKGLEFPIVALPGLHDGPSRHNASLRVGKYPKERHARLGIKYLDSQTMMEYDSQSVLELKELEAMLSDAETRRLFYVALTRARDMLLFSALKTKRRAVKGSWIVPVLQTVQALDLPQHLVDDEHLLLAETDSEG